MKKHYERYTPKKVAEVTGVPEDVFQKICETVATTAAPDRTMTHLYALGWTQHTTGAQNIRCMAMIQLLLGNMGMAGGGVNALRGHSNIQGLTDLGLLSDALPGYLVAAARQRAGLPGLRRQAHPEAAAAGADELPVELPQVPRLADEGLVRQGGDEGERLGVRLPAEARQALRHPDGVRPDVAGEVQRLRVPGLQPARLRAAQGQAHRGALEAEVPRHDRPARHRDLELLAEPRRPEPGRSRPRSRRRCSGCRRRASPRRTARSRTPAGRSCGTGRARSRPARRSRIPRSSPSCSGSCAPCTEGGRRLPGPDPEPDLGLPDRDEALAGGARPRVQRPRPRRPRRPEGRDEDPGEGGRAAPELRASSATTGPPRAATGSTAGRSRRRAT